MKRPWLVGGLVMVLVTAFLGGRHDFVAPPIDDAPSAPTPARLERDAAASAPKVVRSDSAVSPSGVLHPVTDSYLAVFDAQDIRSTVDEVLRSGTADQKGWAATLVQDCRDVLKPEFARKAKDSGDAGEASGSDLARRCAGYKEVPSPELRELRDKLRFEARSSSSDYARLHALSDRADAGDTRWSTVDQAFVAQGLQSGDPVLEYAALEVVISCIDRNIVGGDDRTLALRMIQSRMVEGRRGRVTELMSCAFGAMCNASDAPTTDMTTPEVRRLEKAYRSALESKASPGQLLAMR